MSEDDQRQAALEGTYQSAGVIMTHAANGYIASRHTFSKDARARCMSHLLIMSAACALEAALLSGLDEEQLNEFQPLIHNDVHNLIKHWTGTVPPVKANEGGNG